MSGSDGAGRGCQHPLAPTRQRPAERPGRVVPWTHAWTAAVERPSPGRLRADLQR